MRSERVQRLREQSVNTEPYISTERAELLTDFYQSGIADSKSIPVTRALAFKFILENKEIYIGEDELIVGERGPAPRATPTYPELCCHSISDLGICNNRVRSRFDVDDKAKEVYGEDIIPFWRA